MTIKPTSYRLKNYKMMIKSHQLFNLSNKLSSQIYFSTIWAQTPIKLSNSSLMPSMLPSMSPSRRSLFLTLFLRTSVIRERQLQLKLLSMRMLRNLQSTRTNNWIAWHKRYNQFWPKSKKQLKVPGNQAWTSSLAAKPSKYKAHQQSLASSLAHKTSNQPLKPPKSYNSSSITFNFWSWLLPSKTQKHLEPLKAPHWELAIWDRHKWLVKNRTLKWLKATEGLWKSNRASSKLQSRICSIIYKLKRWSQLPHLTHRARKVVKKIINQGENQ